MGMWGADDPHCRKPLMWKEMSFDDEYRNNFQSSCEQTYDKVAFNQAQFDLYKKLISLRKSNEALITGDIRFLKTEGKKFGYVRATKSQKIVVLFNADNKTQVLDKDTEAQTVDLLSGKVYATRKIRLAPFSAVVLKVK